MIRMTRHGDRLDIVASGLLSESDVEGAAPAFERELGSDAVRTALLDLRGYEGITAGGLVRDLRESLRLVGRIAHLERIALVAEQRWLRAGSELDDAFFPDVEIRPFAPDAIEAAREWLDGAGAARTPVDAAEAARPAIRLLESGRADLLAFEIDGYLDDDDVERLLPAIEGAFAANGTIDLLGRVESFGGFDPALLGDRSFWRMELEGLKKLRRYAVVTSVGWLASLVGLVDRLVDAELRTFALEEEAAARRWLDEGRTSAAAGTVS